MPRSAEPARSALLLEAERLFAEHGIQGVSLRDVSVAAGQRNHSAAQYHFGDRHGLVAAVYALRMGEVNSRRQQRLAALDAEGRGADLDGLVAATIEPLVEVIAEAEGWYGRFLARTRWDPLATEALGDLPVAASIRTVSRRISAQLTDLPPDVRDSRMNQMLNLVIGTLAGWEWARHRGARRLPQDTLTADLIATAVAVLRAPFTTPTTETEQTTELMGAPA